MKKAIVIYTSKRGSTKQYAEWIAEDLGCEARALSDVDFRQLNLYDYDCIVYGGWIRGSGIVDFNKFAKHLDADLMKRLIVFGVGFADETADNYAQVWGYSIGKISFLMKIMRKVLVSGSTKDARKAANKIRDRIDNGVDMVERGNIASLVKDAQKKLV